MDSKDTTLRNLFTLAHTGASWERTAGLSGPARVEPLERAAAAVAASDFHKALGLALSLPLDSDRTYVLRGVFQAAAKTGPGGAAAALAGLPEGAERRDLARLVVSTWAASEPARAAAWITSLPHGATQDAGMAALLPAWVAANPPAAVAWAGRLPAATQAEAQPLPAVGMAGAFHLAEARANRDHALQLIGFEWAKRDHRRAMEWANGLGDAGARRRVMAAIAAVAGSTQ